MEDRGSRTVVGLACLSAYRQPIKSTSAFQVSLPHHKAMKSNRPPQKGRERAAMVMAAPSIQRSVRSLPRTAIRANMNPGKISVAKCGLLDMGDKSTIRRSTTQYSNISMGHDDGRPCP